MLSDSDLDILFQKYPTLESDFQNNPDFSSTLAIFIQGLKESTD